MHPIIRTMRADDVDAVLALQAIAYADAAFAPEGAVVYLNRISLAPDLCLVAQSAAGDLLGYLVSHPWHDGKPPALADTMRPWEKTLARVTHTIFYVLLIGLPLGGWLASSLVGRPVDFFGLFTIPNLPTGSNDALGGAIFDAHALGANFLLILIALYARGVSDIQTNER